MAATRSAILAAVAALLLPDGLGNIQLDQSPPQFDNSLKLATTAFANRIGVQYKIGVAGLAWTANTTLTASQMGGWGIYNSASALTITLPLLSSVPIGAAFTFIGGQSGGAIAASGSDVVFNVVNQSGSQILINPGETITVVADGSGFGWYSVSAGVGHAGFTASLTGSNNYQKFPSGYIRQWGFGTLPASGSNVSSVAVTFPIAFPGGVKSITCNAIGVANSSAGYSPIMRSTAATNSGFTAGADLNGAASTFNQTCLFYWQADGN